MDIIFQSTLPVRGATDFYNPKFAHLGISIHAPREGSDMAIILVMIARIRFQSTLPVRGATSSFPSYTNRQTISIHAPREGSDCKNTQKRICIFGKEYNFYSRQLF